MNKQNLDLLFRNYIDHFGYFQNPNQDGYESYKWEAVEQVQKEWDLGAPDLSGMIKRSFSKTYNLINNRIVSPGNGLALLAKEEPEAVRKALESLLAQVDDLDEKQDNILRFIDDINGLLEKHFPGKWKYTHDVRVAITYLALIIPSQNYLFKSTPAHYFARYMDFDADIGHGANFKLKYYYQMCDELLAEVEACPELLAKDSERKVNWKDEGRNYIFGKTFMENQELVKWLEIEEFLSGIDELRSLNKDINDATILHLMNRIVEHHSEDTDGVFPLEWAVASLENYRKRIQKAYFDKKWLKDNHPEIWQSIQHPPYNTGNDFVYEDDFAENTEEYLCRSGQFDDLGNRLEQNTERNLLGRTVDNIKLDRTSEDLLFQVMLDLGVDLSSAIEERI